MNSPLIQCSLFQTSGICVAGLEGGVIPNGGNVIWKNNGNMSVEVINIDKI